MASKEVWLEYIFPATIEQDDAGIYVVAFRDVQEAMTEGDTLEEAIQMASGALQAAFESRMMDDEDIPQPSKKRTKELLIEVPIVTALKAAIYAELRNQGISRSELARILEVDVKEIRRILNIRHNTKAGRLEDTLHHFGKRVSIKILDSSELPKSA